MTGIRDQGPGVRGIAQGARFGAALAVLALLGCRGEPEPDAYGNFEATEVVVAAETNGQLLRFAAAEGDRIPAGATVALIDTTRLALERDQVRAQRGATASRATEVGRQIEVLEVQREIARRAYERTKRLYDQQAATAQQLDQAERDFRVLGEQIEAARAQRGTATGEVAATEARVAQIAERLDRSSVVNPVGGTVLATYVRVGEFVQVGQPLYRIADLDSLELRAYVTGSQLGSVRIGAPAQVSVDVGDEARTMQGTVTWVASQAEFTPTPIQTREERADLVYAVKIRVANRDGVAKIGMPGEVRFEADEAGSGE